MMHRFLVLALLTLLAGCTKLNRAPGFFDRLAFRYLGETLFSNPDLLTLKEIHLDGGALAGREVLVEGKVAEVSEHGTYLVLTDDSARLLVVLTDVETASVLMQGQGKKPPESMRVLGTVESGKKGLPLLKARAISVVKDPANKAAKVPAAERKA